MARSKIDPMTKSNKKPITTQALNAESVITTELCSDYMAKHGETRLNAGLRFSDAHMELRITLKADDARGLGWVTKSEADAIREHMESHAADPVPDVMKWL